MENIKNEVEESENPNFSYEEANEAEETAKAHAEFSDSDGEAESRRQTAAQNAENAQRRRASEERKRQKREAELADAKRSAREEAILEVLNRTNPYTGEAMSDGRDVEEYLAMREIERRGGDPVGDFAKFHKEKERERAAKETEEAERNRWYADDRVQFEKQFPDVDVPRLIEDARFADYAEGKVGRRPLAAIYEGYLGLMEQSESNARQMAAQMLANRKASPGALSSSEGQADYFSPSEVKKMSPSEVKRHYDVIRNSMSKW